jgi:hypothetical protein
MLQAGGRVQKKIAIDAGSKQGYSGATAREPRAPTREKKMATHAGSNPYSAPQARVADVGSGDIEHAEEIRKEHINHEAGIRSAGTLYGLYALFLLLATLVFAFGAVTGGDAQNPRAVMIIAMVFCGGFFWLFYKLASGLRALQNWARVPTAIISGLGLLGFPVGTLINGYIMWLVLSKKGTFILSPEYAEIVAATPHIKRKTSIVVWIFLVLLLGLFVLLIAAALNGR